MNRRIVEFIVYLAPDMVEDIIAFLWRTVREFGLKRNIFCLAVLYLYLFQLTAGYQEQVLAFLVGKHSAAAYAFDQ